MSGRRFVLAAIGVTAAAVAAAEWYGVLLNRTPSAPLGLYQRIGGPAARGDLVVLCPTDSAHLREARERGYVLPGWRCGGGYAWLLKELAAVAGDEVAVTRSGVAVNGELWPGTAAAERDALGRMLPGAPQGGRVGPGEAWVLLRNDESYDSRYFGPVASAAIESAVRPIWVTPNG